MLVDCIDQTVICSWIRKKPHCHSDQMDAASTDQTDEKQQHKKPRFQLCFSTNDKITNKSDINKATVKLCGISSKGHLQCNLRE